MRISTCLPGASTSTIMSTHTVLLWKIERRKKLFILRFSNKIKFYISFRVLNLVVILVIGDFKFSHVCQNDVMRDNFLCVKKIVRRAVWVHLLAENKNKINLLAENKNRTFTKFENLQNPARARRVGRHAKSNVLKTRAPLQELQCYSRIQRARSAAP